MDSQPPVGAVSLTQSQQPFVPCYLLTEPNGCVPIDGKPGWYTCRFRVKNNMVVANYNQGDLLLIQAGEIVYRYASGAGDELLYQRLYPAEPGSPEPLKRSWAAIFEKKREQTQGGWEPPPLNHRILVERQGVIVPAG